MYFSLALTSLIALGGQAYSQAASGHYVITDPYSGALTVGEGDSSVGFAPEEAGNSTQIWDFAPASQEHVFIQSQDDGEYNGQYLSCPTGEVGAPCTLSPDSQLFTPISQGNDQYIIGDYNTGYILYPTDHKEIILVPSSAISGQDEKRGIFTLSRPSQCENTLIL